MERILSRYFYIILYLCPCHNIPSGFKDYSYNLSPKLGLSEPSNTLFTSQSYGVFQKAVHLSPAACCIGHWHHRATIPWRHLGNTIMLVWTSVLRSAAAYNVISTMHSFFWVKVDNFLKVKFKAVEHQCSSSRCLFRAFKIKCGKYKQ